MIPRPFVLLLLLVPCVGLSGGALGAQAVSRDYFEDATNGFKFKAPKDWSVVPVQPGERDSGIVVQFEGEPISTNIENMAGNWKPDMHVFILEEKLVAPMTGAEASPGGTKGGTGRPDFGEVLKVWRIGLKDLKLDEPLEDEKLQIKKVEVHHRSWGASAPTNVGWLPLVYDTWSFRLEHRDVCLVYQIAEQHYKKWEKTFAKSAKTFVEIEREAHAGLGEGSYEELLAFHTAEAERTPGWRVIPTPSKRFIMTTSSDNSAFLDEVIERLENSRDLFERDFPPSAPIEDVSVVRVCRSEEEFRSYGDTPPGVAGWFNPGTTELVLYDSREIDKKVTFAVMTHEAFHQYCHFLFEESEAHRWFDEGHGDYYGCFEFGPRGPHVTAHMPSGLDRLPILRQILRDKTWVPIREHVAMDHASWQRHGLASYAQSWSIVYMLRQGMLGEVNRRCWDPSYARIIPDYMTALHEGYQDAYAALMKEAEEAAKQQGRALTAEDLEFEVDKEKRDEIWKTALERSWGKVDIDKFQEDWLLFCDKYL